MRKKGKVENKVIKRGRKTGRNGIQGPRLKCEKNQGMRKNGQDSKS